MHKAYIKVPIIILEEDKVSNNAKILYGCIWLYSLKDGYCFASNQHLAKLIRVSPRTITRLLHELKDANYVKTKYENRKRYIKTNLIDNNNYNDWIKMS